MKKNTKNPKTETANAPTAPSPRALMYRISTITRAAAYRAKTEDRAAVFAEALRLIDQTAAQYWKAASRA